MEKFFFSHCRGRDGIIPDGNAGLESFLRDQQMSGRTRIKKLRGRKGDLFFLPFFFFLFSPRLLKKNDPANKYHTHPPANQGSIPVYLSFLSRRTFFVFFPDDYSQQVFLRNENTFVEG